MKLQIIVDGTVVSDTQLPVTLSRADDPGVAEAMRQTLRSLLREDKLTPSQALRARLRVVSTPDPGAA